MEEKFDEYYIDAKLGIKTTGRDDKFADKHIYPYEPTTYEVLDRLVNSGYLSQTDYLIDYGSGKGRVPIYLNSKLGCKAIGIEMMETFYEIAKKNCKNYKRSKDITFNMVRAEQFVVPDYITAAFFFNPFSLSVFKSVMSKVIDSYYMKPRRIRIFLYYPQDEYIAFLGGINEVRHIDVIDCKDIFSLDEKRNVIEIFDIGGEQL